MAESCSRAASCAACLCKELLTGSLNLPGSPVGTAVAAPAYRQHSEQPAAVANRRQLALGSSFRVAKRPRLRTSSCKGMHALSARDVSSVTACSPGLHSRRTCWCSPGSTTRCRAPSW